jgi:hypothetical protein
MKKKALLGFLSLLVVCIAVTLSIFLLPSLTLNSLEANFDLASGFANAVAVTFFVIGASAAIALFPEFAEIPVGVLIENDSIQALTDW